VTTDRPRQPRVATLLPFPLSHTGGVSTFVRGLTRAFKRDYGVELQLIAPNRFRGGPGRRVSQLALGLQLFLRLCRSRPDVVHTHEHPALLAAALVYKAVRRRNVRIVHTVHVHPAEPSAYWKRRILGILFARCFAVTAVSEQTAQLLADVATPVPSSVKVIRGATDIQPRSSTDESVVTFRRSTGIGSAHPVLCQISPLNFPLKVAGAQRLIEAFIQIRARYPMARLLIVGDGLLRQSFEKACRESGVADAVTVTGYVDDVSVPLAMSDVYCHISLQDACPLSVLEAMRCGKPVVAARVGGIPEIVSDGVDGVLVEPVPHAVAEAVLRLLDDPDLARELGSRAAAKVAAQFTWERAAAEFAAIYGLGPAEKNGSLGAEAVSRP